LIENVKIKNLIQEEQVYFSEAHPVSPLYNTQPVLHHDPSLEVKGKGNYFENLHIVAEDDERANYNNNYNSVAIPKRIGGKGFKTPSNPDKLGSSDLKNMVSNLQLGQSVRLERGEGYIGCPTLPFHNTD